MKAVDILKEAQGVMAQRGQQYEKKEEERSMPAVVKAFTAITGKEMTEHDGLIFMCCLKMVRACAAVEQGKPSLDSYVDLAAYASLAGEVATTVPLDLKHEDLEVNI